MKLIHEKQTDEAAYQNVIKLYNLYPEIVMNPKKWKEQRMKVLDSEGKIWSR